MLDLPREFPPTHATVAARSVADAAQISAVSAEWEDRRPLPTNPGHNYQEARERDVAASGDLFTQSAWSPGDLFNGQPLRR